MYAIRIVAWRRHRILEGITASAVKHVYTSYHLPSTLLHLALNEHGIVQLTIGIFPFQRGNGGTGIEGDIQARRTRHSRIPGHILHIRTIAKSCIHVSIELAQWRELTVILIDFRRVALAIPIEITLHVIPIVQVVQDSGHGHLVVLFRYA